MNILQSIIGDVNPKELFETMVQFMHQTVAHQKKMETLQADMQKQLGDIQKRLEELEKANV